MPVTANNRSGFDVFTGDWLQRVFGFIGNRTSDHPAFAFDNAKHRSLVYAMLALAMMTQLAAD
jgi:hypothetical protein